MLRVPLSRPGDLSQRRSHRHSRRAVETADTLAAIKLAKKNGAFLFGIVNAVGSSIARETDTGIYIHVGPEIGVASTKAFTGQLTCLTLLTLALAHARAQSRLTSMWT
jgi:glucosamine 6-phosphate synthetase-like amidotransferase/phosphosugar isomerase protein